MKSAGAVGVDYEDAVPVHTTEKLERRDEQRWELHPASSEDFTERNQNYDKLVAPPKTVSRSKRTPSSAKSGGSAKPPDFRSHAAPVGGNQLHWWYKLSRHGQLAMAPAQTLILLRMTGTPFGGAYPLLIYWKGGDDVPCLHEIHHRPQPAGHRSQSALAAESPSETQLERLMETASQTPDRPDHDYAGEQPTGALAPESGSEALQRTNGQDQDDHGTV